jgi:hypothetical protein
MALRPAAVPFVLCRVLCRVLYVAVCVCVEWVGGWVGWGVGSGGDGWRSGLNLPSCTFFTSHAAGSAAASTSETFWRSEARALVALRLTVLLGLPTLPRPEPCWWAERKFEQ